MILFLVESLLKILKYHQDDVKKVIERLPGKLVIKYYPTRSLPTVLLWHHILNN